MNAKRRGVPVGLLLVLGACLISAPGGTLTRPRQTARKAATGFVLKPNEGEVLVPCGSDGKNWTIKVDPVHSGSTRMAMGTQRVPGGTSIPVHKHEREDEILFIHEGTATGLLGDQRVAVEPGTTLFIPHGVWHGVENAGNRPTQVIWVVSPPGLESYFREVGRPSGTDCRPISPEDLTEIQRRHGLIVKKGS